MSTWSVRGALFGVAAASVASGCVVGGTDRDWAFDQASAVDLELGSGNVEVTTSVDGRTIVAYDGGGAGKSGRPNVEQRDDGTVVADARSVLGGGDFTVEMAAGIPLTVIVDRGDVDIELTSGSDIDACVGAGDVSIGVPAGNYDLQLDAGVGVIDLAIVDEPGAPYTIHACAGAGSLDIHTTDPSTTSE